MARDTEGAERDLVGLPADRAVAELFERHGPLIYNLGLRICGQPDKARDLVQETFLQALRGWDGFEGRSSPTTWLYTIASHACQRMNRTRAGEPAQMASYEELLPGKDATVPDISPPAVCPFDEALKHEAQEIVEQALSAIPEQFRVPLVLKDIVELSVAEIAQVLGIKQNTVKTRVHRARLKLRQALAQNLPNRPAPPRTQPAPVCRDLLASKQEALDRGVEFPVSDQELCARCEATFATLDLGREACRLIAAGKIPDRVREQVCGSLKL